jgi:hypothetical protein
MNEDLKQETVQEKRKFGRKKTTDVVSTIRFSFELRKNIDDYCLKHGMSFNALVTKACGKFIEE